MASVAIYESDEMMRGLLGEWLSHAGYHLHPHDPAGSSLRQPPDLVVMSVQMPKEDALGRLRIVRTVHPGTPVIALSSQFRSGLSSTGAAAQVLGVTRVLAKPLTRSQLLAAVEGVIGVPRPH
jgi:DNA-binding response OmpR family regulator